MYIALQMIATQNINKQLRIIMQHLGQDEEQLPRVFIP
jgi:hypothetical protein